MMQLVVPEVVSFPCAKLVKAMAALISFQYVSSLPFTFSFCAVLKPLLPMTISTTCKHAHKLTQYRPEIRGQLQLVMKEKLRGTKKFTHLSHLVDPWSVASEKDMRKKGEF